MRIYSPLKSFVLTSLIAVSLLLLSPQNSEAQENSWSVSAANWMQYWYHRPENLEPGAYGTSRQDSLDNRFIVDFNLDDFYFGVWMRAFEPNLTSNSFERITQRYVGWREDGITIHAGNFYQTFDRGLTLNAILDDVVNFDNNLDGARISGQYEKFDFDALSGRAVKIETGEREYTIRAFRAAAKPILGLRTGMSYVRFKQSSVMEFGQSEDINLTSINQELNKGLFTLYGEYAFKRGHDELGLTARGDGTYLSGSFSHSLFSVYGEYKNLINLLYPGPAGALNSPPPMSHSGQNLISRDGAPGERGFQAGLLVSPTFDFNIELAFSESFTRGGFVKHYLAEKFAGIRWNPMEKLVLNTHLDRIDFSTEDETEIYGDGYFYLDNSQTLSLAAYTRIFRQYGNDLDNNPVTFDYSEDYLVLGYSRSNFLQVNVGGSLSDNKTSLDPDKLAFIEMILRFRSHELVVFQGGERGGLICSSGICSFRPTFQGTRVTLFSRF